MTQKKINIINIVKIQCGANTAQSYIGHQFVSKVNIYFEHITHILYAYIHDGIANERGYIY